MTDHAHWFEYDSEASLEPGITLTIEACDCGTTRETERDWNGNSIFQTINEGGMTWS